MAFTPPAAYRRWWEKTERCAGIQRSFGRIHWLVVPGDGFNCPGGCCAGRWENDHTIYVAEVCRDREMVVLHEMLHDLLGHAGPPDPPFGVPCPVMWATWNGSGAAVGRSGMEAVRPRID